MSKQKKSSKPRKSSKPLTARKAIQKNQEGLLDSIRTLVASQEQKVSQSTQQLFENQQQLHSGLRASEEHILLLRRVLNDHMLGIVKTAEIERPIFGSEEKEKVTVIDWGWYTVQMDFADTRESFQQGVVLPEEEIKVRIEKKRKLEQAKILDQGVSELVADDLDGADKYLENKELIKEHFLKYLSEKMKVREEDIAWTDDLTNQAAALIAQRINQGKSMREFQKLSPEEQQAKMEEAKAKMEEEAKDFAKVAGEAKEAIESGDEEKAAEAFDEMERRVEAKEREADGLPPKDDGVPDGAAVFGGDQ